MPGVAQSEFVNSQHGCHTASQAPVGFPWLYVGHAYHNELDMVETADSTMNRDCSLSGGMVQYSCCMQQLSLGVSGWV